MLPSVVFTGLRTRAVSSVWATITTLGFGQWTEAISHRWR